MIAPYKAEPMPNRLKEIDSAISAGDIVRARALLGALDLGATDAVILQAFAERYVQLGLFGAAGSLYQRALVLAPDDAGLLYNAATAAIALGRMPEAQAMLDRVIALNPSDYDAYYNRATVKRWTEADNHIDAMEQLLKAGIPDHKGAVQLFYALAKEYEDIGKPEQSFGHLVRGANLRASMMRYDVAHDVKTMAKIAEVFSADVMHTLRTKSAQIPHSVQSGEGACFPVFIVGLPRTGTTLVDRIITSHSEGEGLGEIADLASAIVRLSGPVSDRMELIEKSAEIDFVSLSEQYKASTRGRGFEARVLTDKTPANFLYLGHIAAAMPQAKIIHLMRHPLDTCFAIYKTLFRMGYPYSYRLDHLADYYIAYRKLMAHWHKVMPGQILDVSYENLVMDVAGESRRIIDHCGLAWEDSVLDFHKNTSASATASAAQVRQPVYTSSVGRWREHAEGLAPLIGRLRDAGVDLGEVVA
ncbi:tetratricopeptide repeat-containing sulfotransferase family protein [Kordiimonas gwangyangensis]|uniref:tetratricopeptide repeat-containing sulfotransferase family protein n=1 Tax=Kordiimonas gwangyangensis TaxID=288022 RepID=UPI00037AC251|nr:sulfotransferase [Kordiimonas gwangyangensis]